MKSRLFLIIAIVLGALTPLLAQHEEEKQIAVKLIQSHDLNELKVIVDGEVTTLDPGHLEVGEFREYSLPNGSTLHMERNEDGLWLTVDGEEILVSEGKMLRNRDHVLLESMPSRVVINGLGELDENDRQMIEDAIRATGIDKDVHFVEQGKGFMFVTGGDGSHVLHEGDDAPTWISSDGGGVIKLKVNNKSGKSFILNTNHTKHDHAGSGAKVIFIEKKEDPKDQ